MTRHDMPPTSGRGLLDADANYSDDGLPVRPPPRFGRLALWAVSASALAVGVAGTVAYRVWFDHEQSAYVEALSSARNTLGMSQATLAQASSGAVDISPGTPIHSTPSAAEAPRGAPVNPITTAVAEPAPGQPVNLTAATAETPPGAPINPTTTASAAAPPVKPIDPITTAAGEAPSTTAPLVLSAAPSRAGTQAVVASRSASSGAQQTAQSKANRAQTTQNAAQNRRHTPPRVKPNESLFARMGSFFHRVSYRQNVNGSQRDEYSRP